MEIKEFIDKLQRHHYSLTVDKDRLVLKGDRNRQSALDIEAIKHDKDVIDYIRANKEKLIEHLSGPVVGGDNISAIYRLSPLQAGMLFHNLYDEKAGAYRNQLKCDLIGVDEDAFVRSWNHLLRQHSILRSSFFHDVFKIPVQCVHKEVRMPVEILDYRHMAGPERAEAAAAFEEGDRKRPFDFKKAPLMRVTLIRLDEERTRMLWTSQHILIDGWSMPVLMEEFLSTYDSIAAGVQPEVHEEDRYEDYIRYLESRDKEQEEEYWRKYLANVSGPTLLPFAAFTADRTKSVGVFREELMEMDEALTERIEAFARSGRITVNTLMQGIWALLLHRYTGQQDITYGVVVSGRPDDLEGVEKRVGMYINTLPLYSGYRPESGIREWLQGIQQDQFRSRAEQYASLPDIQRWSQVRGDLFDSIIVFQNYPVSKVVASKEWGMRVEDLVGMEQSSSYPLLIRFVLDRGITVQWIYKEESLLPKYVRQMIGHFRQVLVQILDGAAGKVGELSMAGREEMEMIIRGFNEAGRGMMERGEGKQGEAETDEWSRSGTLTGLFSERVRSGPGRTALVYGTTELSYAQVDEHSDRVAGCLAAQGVGLETPVAICMDRSPEMILGILGILKAGGAYVPIDPEYPAERAAYILDDSGAKLVLCDERSSRSMAGLGCRIIKIGSDLVCGVESAAGRSSIEPGPANAAYIIYTSGSTGRPKGVVVEHGSIMNFILSERIALGVGEDERVLLFSNFCFDASVEQIFLALTSGSSLVIMPGYVLTDKDAFERFLDIYRITHLHVTPTFLQAIVPQRFGYLRRIVAGGEVCRKDLGVSWSGYCSFYNKYGPTEAAVTVAEYKCGPELLREGCHSVPIGKPLPNTRLYILDEEGRPVPLGVAGELYIGGVQLARGYLNNPGLTAERFVCGDPAFMGGERVYRTGDICRWLPDGNIEYLGRSDDQVKIRGYRIELGEIESALQRVPGMKQSAVVVSEDLPGSKRLVGYVVMERTFDQGVIFEILKDRLPEYMLPSRLVELEAMPLTQSGKTDRKALSAMEIPLFSEREYEAPRDEMERSISEIFQELLGLERVGIHDNFFELGGDSIISVQVVSRMRRMGFEIKVTDLIIYQTIARISGAIRDRASEVREEEEREGEEGGLLPVQRQFFEQAGAEPSHYNQSVFLAIGKEISINQVNEAMKALVLRHASLRLAYRKDEQGEWRQRAADRSIEVQRADLTTVSKQELEERIGEICRQGHLGLNIRTGELTGVVFISMPEEERDNRLFIVVHHLAIDGISWRVLLEELEILLSTPKEGHGAVLGRKGSSYIKWHSSLVKYAGSGRLRSQAAYWRRIAHSYTGMPTDREEGEGPLLQADLRQYVNRVPAKATYRLLHEIAGVYHTEINEVLMAALAATLCRYSGRDSVVIGLEGHGREELGDEVDISRTVGWFTSKYPVVLTWEEGLPAADLLKKTKENIRSIPDRGLGYGVLRYMAGDEGLAGQCWEVLFNYLGQTDNVIKDGGLLKGAQGLTGEPASQGHVISERISINSLVTGGEMVVRWNYSGRHYLERTIVHLAEAFVLNLEMLVDHCLEQKAKGVSGHTPSDWGLTGDIGYQELDQFLSEESSAGRMRKDELEGCYRLSPLQSGMLFHHFFNENDLTYRNQLACDLPGLDEHAFLEAWRHLTKAHNILRSCIYHDRFKIPVQCIYRHIEIPIERLDYRGMGERMQEEKTAALEMSERRRGFDLKRPPLMHLVLVQLDDRRYRMIWTFHHILMDGWSLPVLMEEFLSGYESIVTGKAMGAIPEDRYQDYIRYLEGRDRHADEAYWRKYLGEAARPTLLPFVDASAGRNGADGGYSEQTLKVSAALAKRIEAYSKQEHVTVNTIMQGVWAYLLHCYTGQRDVTFGVVVSGRPAYFPDVEKRVGMYINTLPLVCHFPQNAGISEWLRDLQQRQLEAREHQYTPLADLQKWSGVHGSLFDSIMAFQNYPVSKVIGLREWALQVEGVRMKEQAHFPFYISVGVTDSININFFYNPEVMDPGYPARLLGQFEHVLSQMTEGADRSLADLRPITSREEAEITGTFNQPYILHPGDRTFIDVFEMQLADYGERMAIVASGAAITYRELNERANQAAFWLRGKGVGEETLVPICIDRPIERVIWILGIWKAGGAYVPVEPAGSERVIDHILSDTAARLVVVDGSGLSAVQHPEVEIADIGFIADEVQQRSCSNPDRVHGRQHAAYVLYTSGSTGRPKGVLVEHGSLMVYLENGVALYSGDRHAGAGSLIHLPYTFDASLTAMFLPLLCGKFLVMPDADPVDVWSEELFIKNAPFDFIKLTPAHLPFVGEALRKKPDFVLAEKLILGGEALYGSHARYLTNAGYEVELINEYGPTEATVGCAAYFLKRADGAAGEKAVPIGKPMSNTRIYIVDGSGRLAGVGVQGEIWIGGGQLARGYLNDVELTNEKFIADVFSGVPGQRLYRSGDLGRWLPDGNIVYTGRLDDQVKIRGYRVEPGEIEAHLSACPGIQQARVVVTEDAVTRDKRLTAYAKTDRDRLPLLSNYQRVVRTRGEGVQELHVLPNGLPVFGININEVRFLYQEIFAEQCYLQHGLYELASGKGRCVVDIGANIGFFSIFMNLIARDATIYSIEPIPEVFACLEMNRALYDIKGKAFQLALSSAEGQLDMTYYPEVSVVSGVGGDDQLVRKALRSYLGKESIKGLADEEVEMLLDSRLNSRIVSCAAGRLSQIIESEGIEYIDLLKIDVENSEEEVLDGIDEEDWGKIGSLIVEVHHTGGRLERMISRLEAKGFRVYSEREGILSNDDMFYNLFCFREGQERPLKELSAALIAERQAGWVLPGKLQDGMIQYLRERLPEHMVPGQVHLLDEFPLTKNGKIDREALKAMRGDGAAAVAGDEPEDEIETSMLEIWKELLERGQIGMTDDFFRLGGDSLLAIRVISAVRRRLEAEIPIRVFFDLPSIREQAKYIKVQQYGQQEMVEYSGEVKL